MVTSKYWLKQKNIILRYCIYIQETTKEVIERIETHESDNVKSMKL